MDHVDPETPSDPTEPSATALRGSPRIALTREPVSDAAHALTATVIERMGPHLRARRKLGQAGAATLTRDTGIILAGVLRGALKDSPVSAQRRRSGDMWAGDVVMGQQRFWTKVDAMAAAGLVGLKDGTRGPAPFGGWGGHPTRLWGTVELTSLASQHCVTWDTFWSDWRVVEEVQRQRKDVPVDDLVILRPFDENRRLAIPADQQETAAVMRSDVAALNAHVAKAQVTGCRAPVFQRKFRHCLELGGRLYAMGEDTVQTIPRQNRCHMTINGRPVAEVDLSASFLSIALALTGTRRLPKGDLYALGGLERQVVKAFLTQTFGSGKVVSKWSDRTSAAAREIKPSVIRKVAVLAYPFLQDLTALVPARLMKSVPLDRRGWAVGQYLTFVESEIVGAAISNLRDRDILALPLHDALIVARPHARTAKAALSAAFKSRLGVVPHIKVDSETRGDALGIADAGDGQESDAAA